MTTVIIIRLFNNLHRGHTSKQYLIIPSHTQDVIKEVQVLHRQDFDCLYFIIF